MQKKTPLPTRSDRRVRAGFARAAVHMAFGHHARALDQADFIDREPWQNPVRAPGAWVR